MSSLTRLRQKMADHQVPAVLVSDITNVGWLTGFTGSSGFAIVTQDGGCFVTDSRYTSQAGDEVKGLPVQVYGSPTPLNDFLAEQVRQLNLAEVAIEGEKVSVAQFEDWKRAFGAVQVASKNNFVSPLRMVKSDSEVEAIRHCCGLADACFQHVTRLIQPGVSEYDIALEIELYFRRQGATSAFDIIVASGFRSAYPHGRASEKKLEAGDFVTLDFGACKNGFNSDLTRTVVVGEPTDRQVEVYEQVLKAEVAAIEAIRPGIPCKEIDALSRRILAEKNLDGYFGHGLGHGLGRLVHDAGRLAATSTDVLEEGQVWTVEPGVYIEGWGGVRIEDDILVTATGAEILTHAPKHLMAL